MDSLQACFPNANQWVFEKSDGSDPVGFTAVTVGPYLNENDFYVPCAPTVTPTFAPSPVHPPTYVPTLSPTATPGADEVNNGDIAESEHGGTIAAVVITLLIIGGGLFYYYDPMKLIGEGIRLGGSTGLSTQEDSFTAVHGISHNYEKTRHNREGGISTRPDPFVGMASNQAEKNSLTHDDDAQAL